MDTWMGNNHDPITLHKYLYANADPGNMVDPTGNFSIGSVMSAVNTMATLANRAYTAYSLFDVATSTPGEFNAKQAGFMALTALGGGKILKLVSSKARRHRPSTSRNQRRRCRTNSFDADTLIHTVNGLAFISNIEIGDQVLSYDEKTRVAEYNEVIHLIQSEKAQTIYSIELDSGEVIDSTDEHPFFVDGNWVLAKDLNVNDRLTLVESQQQIVNIRTSLKTIKVFNFTVDKAHTYYVGTAGVLVHNAGPCNQILFRAPHQYDIDSGGAPIIGSGEFYTEDPIIAAGYAARYGAGLLVVEIPKPRFRSLLRRNYVEIDYNEKDAYQVINQPLFNRAIVRRKYAPPGTMELFDLIEEFGLPFF